jgi:hypothetical protein
MLARYVRNSPCDNFTATDVAVVDYIRDLHDDDGLAKRIEGPGYFDFLGRDPRVSRAEQERDDPARAKGRFRITPGIMLRTKRDLRVPPPMLKTELDHPAFMMMSLIPGMGPRTRV